MNKKTLTVTKFKANELYTEWVAKGELENPLTMDTLNKPHS